MMCLAMIVFTSLDTQAKHLVLGGFPGPVGVFFRYAVTLLIATVVLVWQGSPNAFVTRHPWLQLLRGVTLMCSTLLNFTAMFYLQLTQTAAIFFTSKDLGRFVSSVHSRSK